MASDLLWEAPHNPTYSWNAGNSKALKREEIWARGRCATHAATPIKTGPTERVGFPARKGERVGMASDPMNRNPEPGGEGPVRSPGWSLSGAVRVHDRTLPSSHGRSPPPAAGMVLTLQHRGREAAGGLEV